MAVDSFCDGHDKVYLQLAVSVTAGGPPGPKLMIEAPDPMIESPNPMIGGSPPEPPKN